MTASHDRAWEDWGSIDPLYAILTDPKYQHGGGDRAEFLSSGEGLVAGILGHCDELGLAQQRRRALDFGCGVGRVTAPLAACFDEVVGLDVSASMVEGARSMHALDNCTFAVHRGNDLRQYPDASFDLVVCVLVLQHLASRDLMLGYLAEFARVLRPGGAIAVQLPSKVPPPPPLPKWKTRAGLRYRAASTLRRLGVRAPFLNRHFAWVPPMTMTAVPDDVTRATLAEHGAPVVFATPLDVDAGGTESRLYFARR